MKCATGIYNCAYRKGPPFANGAKGRPPKRCLVAGLAGDRAEEVEEEIGSGGTLRCATGIFRRAYRKGPPFANYAKGRPPKRCLVAGLAGDRAEEVEEEIGSGGTLRCAAGIFRRAYRKGPPFANGAKGRPPKRCLGAEIGEADYAVGRGGFIMRCIIDREHDA